MAEQAPPLGWQEAAEEALLRAAAAAKLAQAPGAKEASLLCQEVKKRCTSSSTSATSTFQAYNSPA